MGNKRKSEHVNIFIYLFMNDFIKDTQLKAKKTRNVKTSSVIFAN